VISLMPRIRRTGTLTKFMKEEEFRECEEDFPKRFGRFECMWFPQQRAT